MAKNFGDKIHLNKNGELINSKCKTAEVTNFPRI